VRLQLLEGAGDTPQLDKRPHDLDIYGNRPIAAKDPGEHGHTLLGEDIGRIAAPAPAIV